MSDQVREVRFLRLPEVLKRTGLSRATLYRRIREGHFPEPQKDGNCSFWPDYKVFAYQTALSPDLAELIG